MKAVVAVRRRRWMEDEAMVEIADDDIDEGHGTKVHDRLRKRRELEGRIKANWAAAFVIGKECSMDEMVRNHKHCEYSRPVVTVYCNYRIYLQKL
jgi:hypothetical protein